MYSHPWIETINTGKNAENFSFEKDILSQELRPLVKSQLAEAGWTLVSCLFSVAINNIQNFAQVSINVHFPLFLG